MRRGAPDVVFGNGLPVLDEQRHVVIEGSVEADDHVDEKDDVDGEIELAVPIPGAVGADEDDVVWDLR